MRRFRVATLAMGGVQRGAAWSGWMQGGFGDRGQQQGRRQCRQSCAQRGGSRTQLHRDENSKCGWVAREQLLWEQAEEEFSHSEGASWGKIQEFSAAMEGKKAG